MTLHESLMTDPSKITTSFSLLKKRKKRRDLDKLIIGRQYQNVRTSSCQDFHKMNNVTDCNDLLSSTDDTTTLLNSTDEGLEYLSNSINRQKSKILCCNYNTFIVFSCLLNILTITGCILLTVLLFVNKNSLEEWKEDKYHDMSHMKYNIEQLQSQVSSSKFINNVDYINQTIVNYTSQIQFLEEKTNDLNKRIIKLNDSLVNAKNLTEMVMEINMLKDKNSKIIDLLNSNTRTIIILKKFYNKLENSSNLVLINNNTNTLHIQTLLFHPSQKQIDQFPNESTAVLLSLSEYKTFLQYKSNKKP